jgi:hypothetical protein
VSKPEKSTLRRSNVRPQCNVGTDCTQKRGRLREQVRSRRTTAPFDWKPTNSLKARLFGLICCRVVADRAKKASGHEGGLKCSTRLPSDTEEQGDTEESAVTKKTDAAVLIGLALAIVGCCSWNRAIAEVPSILCGPNECQYLVNDGVGNYPTEEDRVEWECYDTNSKVSIGCTFVRGDDIYKYSDVYKKRPSNYQPYNLNPNNFDPNRCALGELC